jgi:hypothetical protein
MMLTGLALSLALCSGATLPPPPDADDGPRHRLAVGAQVGFVHVLGAQAVATFFHHGRPRFDLDLLWEPSTLLQSYSLGAAYHPFDQVAFVGTRARLVQWHPPLSRGFFPAADNHLGLGAEVGARVPIALDERLILTVATGATWVPTANAPIQWLANLNVGLGWALVRR